MPLQPCPNTISVRLFGDLSGEMVINDLAFVKESGAVTFVDVTDVGNAIGDWYRDSVVPLLDDRYYFMQMVAVDLSNPVSYKFTGPYATQGGVSGGGAPNNVSFCLSFKSGLSGRAGNGRNFLPGIPLQYLSGNLVNEEPLAALLAAYSALLAEGEGVIPAGFHWCVVSRRLAGVDRVPAVPVFVTSVVATDNIVDSQRRRLPGRGR